MNDEDERELLRLLQLDFEATSKFIERLAGLGVTLRGWAITLTLGLLGVAFERHLWQLAFLAFVVSVMFIFVDAYYLWMYMQALFHARAIDRVFVAYYGSLTRGPEDHVALEEFNDRLEAHTFGLSANILRFRFPGGLRSLWRNTAISIFYAMLLVMASVSTILLVRDP